MLIKPLLFEVVIGPLTCLRKKTADERMPVQLSGTAWPPSCPTCKPISGSAAVSLMEQPVPAEDR